MKAGSFVSTNRHIKSLPLKEDTLFTSRFVFCIFSLFVRLLSPQRSRLLKEHISGVNCAAKGLTIAIVTDGEILRQIGRNVRTARHKAGMTQECLAELTDVHWKTIGRIERGQFPFAVTTFARLSQHLKVSPNRLLEDLPEPDQKLTEKITKALARKRKPCGSI